MLLRRMLVVLAALALTGGFAASLRADPATQDQAIDAGKPLATQRGPAVYHGGAVSNADLGIVAPNPAVIDRGNIRPVDFDTPGAPGAVVNYGPIRIVPSVSVGLDFAPAPVVVAPAYPAYAAPAPAYVYYGSYAPPVYYARPYCYAPSYYCPPVYYSQPCYGSGLIINPFIGLRLGFGFVFGGHGRFGFGRR